ncbi:Protein of unknown function [Ectothiorhodospira magna]|uniref:J domain-containing protein n=1 Tax=Ectothiorhodospira magna TaxID=867345 RepID=A0A1H9AUE3_9GAMM|nr:DnaJ domain-containing protein [Ectothiorhodospira magna]SEP79558.1 Protein of unknown function [Ectothiorhodospira magna]
MRLRTHYDNLQVTENASPEVIRGAYKFLSQKWHPDKNQHQREKAERITKILNDAYTVLSDPERRREHDVWIASQRHGRQFQLPEPVSCVIRTHQYDYQYAYALSPVLTGRGERFINLGDGTVMDLKTGLQWFIYSVGECWRDGEVSGSPGIFSAADALRCQSTFNDPGHGGLRDWRMPTRKELKSIHVRSLISLRRGLDESVFSPDYKAPYWTLHDNPWLYDNRPVAVSLTTDNPGAAGDDPKGRLRWVRGPDLAMLIELNHQMAKVFLHRREFTRAMESLRSALQLAEVPGRVELENLLVIRRDLAVACFQSGDSRAAEEGLQSILADKQAHYGRAHVEVLGALLDLAALQKSTQRLLQAKDTLQEAYHLLSDVEVQDQRVRLGILYDVLVLLVWSRDFARAEALLTEFLEPLGEDEFNLSPERTTLMMLVLGLLRETLGQGERGAGLYRLFLRLAPPPLASAGDFGRMED